MHSYFQPRKMFHTLPAPSLSFSGQFNVLLFFLEKMDWLRGGEKDEFIMTRPRVGGKQSFSFLLLRHVYVVIFGKVKLSFSCEQLILVVL